MKVKTGGGGIDKDGNTYKLPETEHEVPDGYFTELLKAMADPTPKPAYIYASPEAFKAYLDATNSQQEPEDAK
jgi:hypothetical protein